MRTRFSKIYHQFISLKGDARKISLGFSVGVMIGFFPILGTHWALVLLFAALFRGHFTAAWLGSWLSGNPLTFPPMFVVEFYLGKWILGYESLVFPEMDFAFASVLQFGWNLVSAMVIGGIVIGGLFALAAFPVMHGLIVRARKRIPMQRGGA